MPQTEVHRALIMKAVDDECTDDAQFERLWAREFRYDGPRQRYLVRVLDPVTLAQPYETSGDVWTDYIGDTAVLDYRFESTGAQDEIRLAGYLPGVSQTDLAGLATQYMHGDHLGSTWFMTDEQSPVTSSRRAVRTAFGEHVSLESGPATRHGYAGAWGYQEHDYDANGAGDGLPDAWYDANGMADGFPYLHVGWRYYDPASGRFLQRDPIGIRGGLNVYAYVNSNPLRSVDPSGLFSLEKGAGGALIGGLIGAGLGSAVPVLGTTAGGIIGGVIGGFIGNGYEEGDAAALACGIKKAARDHQNYYRPPPKRKPFWRCPGCARKGNDPIRPGDEGPHLHPGPTGKDPFEKYR